MNVVHAYALQGEECIPREERVVIGGGDGEVWGQGKEPVASGFCKKN